MQDWYAGDVGTFALLGSLAVGKQLGVCWYLRSIGSPPEVGASSVEVVRLRPYSSRFYVLVDAHAVTLAGFCEPWGDAVEHDPRRDL